MTDQIIQKYLKVVNNFAVVSNSDAKAEVFSEMEIYPILKELNRARRTLSVLKIQRALGGKYFFICIKNISY